ncbi:MAG: T9SS type A sorting domain-containing protein [Ignavibacteria bacterium]|nr:T9SS type A sorting domain-containing protein [Ignavibacteria bacterium]
MKTRKNFLSAARKGYCFHGCVQTAKLITAAFIALILASPEIANSQSLEWRELPGIPYTGGRYDDLYFIDANTGWVLGEGIYKTTNSGISWTNYQTGFGGRSVGFFDSQTGIIGDFSLSSPLIRTTDGGATWVPVSFIADPRPSGICGISIVDENTAYSCGTFGGDGKAYKTTDKGQNWHVAFNDTSLARTLVDCYFWSKDSGLIAGGYTTNTFTNGVSVVLLTTNGGSSWQTVHKSFRGHEWCWKISFNPAVSKSFGVISIQSFTDSSFYLKTTNGGFNWDYVYFMDYEEEGIGFLNQNTGWIGGYGNSSVSDSTYQTTDGGLNWEIINMPRLLNRIRFINDTLAFACGRTVSKYSRDVVNISPVNSEKPVSFNLYQNYPNPFNPKTVIKFDIVQGQGHEKQHGKLVVYDAIGKVIRVLIDEQMNPGGYAIGFDGGYYPSGIYYYKLEVGSGIYKYSQTRKMLILK